MTAIVCIPRHLAVVVSLKNYAALSLFLMSDQNVNTAVLVYNKYNRIVRTYRT